MKFSNNINYLFVFIDSKLFIFRTIVLKGTAVAQWLRCCATNRKVAGSIPDGVIGIFQPLTEMSTRIISWW